MPSYIAATQSSTRDGSTGPGTVKEQGSPGVVMVTAPDAESAKREAAVLLGVDPHRVTITPLEAMG